MIDLGLTGHGDAPAGGDDLVKDTTTQTFMADVVEASRETPVLVDFWAPWCGPCKTLGPAIEKVVRAMKGRVKLVKMNIDEHPAVAQQMGVQSIPAVFAFADGRPVDGFMGALPESQIRAFVERVAGGDGGGGTEEVLAAAEEAFASGDVSSAASAFAAVLQEDRENVTALGGLARCLVKSGELDRARQTLALVPPGKENDPAVASARAALELAEQAESLGDTGELAARVEAAPDDHQARFDLALALNAAGDRRGAAEHLLEIVRRDRAWNEEAARKQLVQFFEAWGPKDPATGDARRRLSSLLFA